MMSIGALLETEIEEKLETIGRMNPELDEYKVAVDSIMKLLDRAIEMDKIDADREERKEIRESEEKSKKESAKNENKHYIIDKIITV